MNIKIPEYKSNSTLSLMSSIRKYLDKESGSLFYQDLKCLPTSDLDDYNSIVMIIVDGLGYEILQKLSNQSDFIYKSCLSIIDTVLPTTTIAAVTSFSTGLSPREHGVLGWNMKLRVKNEDITAQLLPFLNKDTGSFLSKDDIDLKQYLPERKRTNNCNNTYTILPEGISSNPFFQELIGFEGRSEQVRFYRHPLQCLSSIAEMVKARKHPKQFIYSYLPHLDHFSHLYGTESHYVQEFYRVFKKALDKLLKRLKGSNSLVIITADHGLVDSQKSDCLFLDDFNELKQNLDFSICGEPRLSYFYVKEDCKQDFIQKFRPQLAPYGDLYSSNELMNAGFWGPTLLTAHREAAARVGDFCLVMKGNYLFKESREKPNCNFIGNHGSNSDTELKVPLIVFK